MTELEEGEIIEAHVVSAPKPARPPREVHVQRDTRQLRSYSPYAKPGAPIAVPPSRSRDFTEHLRRVISAVNRSLDASAATGRDATGKGPVRWLSQELADVESALEACGAVARGVVVAADGPVRNRLYQLGAHCDALCLRTSPQDVPGAAVFLRWLLRLRGSLLTSAQRAQTKSWKVADGLETRAEGMRTGDLPEDRAAAERGSLGRAPTSQRGSSATAGPWEIRGHEGGVLAGQNSGAAPRPVSSNAGQSKDSLVNRTGSAADQSTHSITIPTKEDPEVILERVLDSIQPPQAADLLRQGKLALVLDLDHTLLNSSSFEEVVQSGGLQMEMRLLQQEARQHRWGPPDAMLHRIEHLRVWTKLRPGVHAFLRAASELFQMTVHTNGQPAYAAAVMSVLDPSGEFFGSRVVAQGADLPKSLAGEGLRGLDAVALIVDDNAQVWPGHAHNLIPVEQYHYFPSSRARQGLSGPSLLEQGRDEDAENGILAITLRVLRDVHAACFGALRAPPTHLPTGEVVRSNWDVRAALATRRHAVLAGVWITFSHVIAVDEIPKENRLWRAAEDAGARCSSQLLPHTTHLVAGSGRTEKVYEARKKGIPVVSPAWLECSRVLWKRADEEAFPVQ